MKLTSHFTHEDVVRSAIAARYGIVQVPTAGQMERATWLAVHVLEPIAVRLGAHRPLIISSWLRTVQVNGLVGGTRNSAHIEGRAVDVEAPPWSNIHLARWIREQNFFELDKVILEFPNANDPRAGWVHVQVAKKGEIARGESWTAKRIADKTVFTEGLSL